MTRPVPPSARGELDELLGVVSELVDRVLAIEQRDQRPEQDTADARPPFCWEELEAEELRETWHELGAWVRWLCERFRIDDIPPCWYLHGDLVEELTGLWLAWLGAYHAGARSEDPVRWLDWLARARARFARRSPRCQINAHKEHGSPLVHGEGDFTAFVDLQAATTIATEV
ncbi:hypothetical protein Ga0074812_14710 [Parafrankia irregularis]|uniref:DUF4913 domain-containing protein n=1 Tax=Parafrankia irregularis TaxID=795642 RepID=A0A0S4R0N9_9ACTN|nr:MULTISPECIES: hypothetical protein [Parafrankia]MBE3206673.1 hypothetical protein [Parafrankia sp. CH37]CUU60764.1 hypothetical protein Ga0074812_14710 [Parafrankia irregularis]